MLTKTGKQQASEEDVVELTESLPEYGFVSGQRGIVISGFTEPAEAYDLAMESEYGDFLGFAYSVKPAQFVNVSANLLKEGLDFLVRGELVKAERKLKAALAFTPKLQGTLLNIILNYSEKIGLDTTIVWLRTLCRIAPNDELASENLAIALLKLAVSKANNANLEAAEALLIHALEVASSPNITARIQETFAEVLIELAEEARVQGKLEESISKMRLARAVFPNPTTLLTLGRAYANLALAYRKSRNYDKAIDSFEAAEMAGFVRPELLNDYAIVLIAVGQREAALAAFERALEIEPDNQEIRRNLGLLQNNQPVEAFATEQVDIPYTPIHFTMPQYQMAQMAA